MKLSREQMADFERAHSEHCHDEFPREFCPTCEDERSHGRGREDAALR